VVTAIVPVGPALVYETPASRGEADECRGGSRYGSFLYPRRDRPVLTLLIVLGFPLLLTVGYGLLFVLSGRDMRVVTGPAGFVLYLVLVTIPAGVVLGTYPGRASKALAWPVSAMAWLSGGALAGLALWGVQRWGLPGRTPEASERVWVGPPGRIGFVLLLVPVAYIVLAEELVWRAYLLPELGLLLSAAAFALHHYHFGLRHVVFSLLAGLAWGGLFILAGSLWPAVVSHLVYNALAWRHMRRSASGAAHASDLREAGAVGRSSG
jgi:membrane protease YdiL (CAAX protease family)